jgi:hypothetical protein
LLFGLRRLYAQNVGNLVENSARSAKRSSGEVLSAFLFWHKRRTDCRARYHAYKHSSSKFHIHIRHIFPPKIADTLLNGVGDAIFIRRPLRLSFVSMPFGGKIITRKYLEIRKKQVKLSRAICCRVPFREL